MEELTTHRRCIIEDEREGEKLLEYKNTEVLVVFVTFKRSSRNKRDKYNLKRCENRILAKFYSNLFETRSVMQDID